MKEIHNNKRTRNEDRGLFVPDGGPSKRLKLDGGAGDGGGGGGQEWDKKGGKDSPEGSIKEGSRRTC
ncbi:unnamed protein product [Vitrella brassicaformis CCMP3155]|uniref:Uncharacterized protein n=1 Tax=Vitrella brassicaformis (strain CCMP3155) TaxID=1169540 RepID=A0A0G4GMJ8_VITBC|nr:unnamed protein product [Vitrella brassicaformis CCMP3155]|eukprot:CEM31419.1 unnamed protein product [Vitrella brassicaformis CCMP3155]